MSPCYALKINKLINELNITSQKKIIEQLKTNNTGLKKKVKDYYNIISEIREELNKNSLENKMVLESIANKLNNTSNELKETTNKLNKAINFIEEVKHDCLYIYKIQITETSPIFYTSYRILKTNKKKTFAKHINYVKAEKIFSKCSINSVRAWIEFKTNNNNIYIKTNGKFYNDFTFLKKYNETDLKRDLEKLFSKLDNVN